MPASSRTRESRFRQVLTSTAATYAGTGRVLVAGVGYRNLRDLSAGPLIIERLGAASLGERVDLEDLSYGPIDVLFLLQRREPYAAAIFVAAEKRGRRPGSVHRAAWGFPAITTEALQERIAEAVTGVISLENLLHICGHFSALPSKVTVIEVEPVDDGWGESVSEAGAAAVDAAVALVASEVSRALEA